MNRADAFGRANWISRQLSLTAISYDAYKTTPDRAIHQIMLNTVMGDDAVVNRILSCMKTYETRAIA